MGFSKFTALAFAALASVAAADDLEITKVADELSQVDTNGTPCLLPTNYCVR